MEKQFLQQKEALANCGSVQQLAFVRSVTYAEGAAEGLRAYDVKNGPLRFTVLAGKCLDIADASFNGVNLSFLARQGLAGRGPYDVDTKRAGRSIMGGLLFTAGLENICAPGQVGGVDYVTHGSMRSIPAAHTGCDAAWKDGNYEITVHGEMRQAALFGENMVLRRTIRTVFGQNRIYLSDEVQNQGHEPQPLSILYHCNVGYPLLDEGARLIMPTTKIAPRDAAAKQGQQSWHTFGAPTPQKQEQVFIHSLAANAQHKTFAAVVNDKLGLGLCLRFVQVTLPRFFEWKSEAAGDYACGLEPANASVLGRQAQLEQEGSLHMLEPMQTRRFELCFEVLDGADSIAALERERDELMNYVGHKRQ